MLFVETLRGKNFSSLLSSWLKFFAPCQQVFFKLFFKPDFRTELFYLCGKRARKPWEFRRFSDNWQNPPKGYKKVFHPVGLFIQQDPAFTATCQAIVFLRFKVGSDEHRHKWSLSFSLQRYQHFLLCRQFCYTLFQHLTVLEITFCKVLEKSTASMRQSLKGLYKIMFSDVSNLNFF